MTFILQTPHLTPVFLRSLLSLLPPPTGVVKLVELRPAAENAQPRMPWDDALGRRGSGEGIGLTMVNRWVKAEGGRGEDVMGEASFGAETTVDNGEVGEDGVAEVDASTFPTTLVSTFLAGA